MLFDAMYTCRKFIGDNLLNNLILFNYIITQGKAQGRRRESCCRV